MLELPDEIDPFIALAKIKNEMRSTGKAAMKRIMKKNPDLPETKMQHVLQISRAIAHNDSGLARLVKRDNPELGSCFTVSEEGTIFIIDTQKFNLTTAKYAKEFHDKEARENDRSLPGLGKTNRKNHLNRLMDQWSPFSRKSVNLTISKHDGSNHHHPRRRR